jgi:two-component system response regulator HydG
MSRATAVDAGEAVDRPIRTLIVDDDEAHAEALSDVLEGEGHPCRIVHSGAEAVDLLGEQSFDAVLTDVVMPGVSGMDVLEAAVRLQPDAAVLLVTGHESVKNAVDAMRRGAADYLPKPVDPSELRTRLARAVEARRLRRANVELRRQIDKRYGFEGILGSSSPMQKVFDVLVQVASSSATVLILGESGTGKELVARAIHQNSPRRERNFVAVNCAALSEGLIESELFGHVKGAFTGAVAHKEGRIVYADGGTLFLDEVGDMPLETQAKLLRVLEMREVQAVGGNTTRKVDVRLVAATNRDLRGLVEEGKFREDLLFRLQVVTVVLPPLRERPGDVPLLIDHFLSSLAEEHGRDVRGITPEARGLLVRYDWPGNVRELRNALETMVLLARRDVLDVDDVPEHIQSASGRPTRDGGHYEIAGRSLADVERDLIEATLALTEGNRQKAAKMIGIGERTLYRKLNEYGLS